VSSVVDTQALPAVRTGGVPGAWGTTTALILAIVPRWDPAELPPRWHSCTRYSRRGLSKVQPALMPRRVTREFCPCGGYRELLDGRPFSGWWDKNQASRDELWLTRADRPHEPFVRLL